MEEEERREGSSHREGTHLSSSLSLSYSHQSPSLSVISHRHHDTGLISVCGSRA